MRPRVYLIDFETAVSFRPETNPAERLVNRTSFPTRITI